MGSGRSDVDADRVGTVHDSMTDDVDEEEDVDARLARGTAVDRYVVLHELGAGGMGVVYSAYDPELDRRVAVKLLQAKSRGARARDRLMREAKAIAKLSHPNVVTVHDVGTFDGRVFIAMEYIDGSTLRRWIRRTRPSAPEIITALISAGRGLAAAHAADLVHRDFKPDNVLVESSGRVVVLDFGLARRSSSASSEVQAAPADTPVSDSVDELGLHLTKTGARLGTPAYMAPEQHLGLETDARTDQFAFCVVLWEALYGVRPFSSHTPRGVALRVIEGKIDDPPRGVAVATWVRKILVRGLSRWPTDRHPTMDALLRELAGGPVRRRRAAVAAGGAATVALAGFAGAALFSSSETHQCDRADARWDGVWDVHRRSEIADVFERTGAPFADVAALGVTAALDQYRREWAAMYRDACEATAVHKEQSAGTMDLRMACLRGRHSDAAALLQELAVADANVVEHAVEAVRSLPRVAACGNVEALSADVPLPADPRTAVEAREIWARLSDALAKESAGRYAPALEVVARLEGRARELGYLPLLAEVHLRRGSILERTGDFEGAEAALLEAVWVAKATRHGRVESDAWVRLVWVTGVERKDAAQGRVWARFARATLQARSPDPVLEASLAHNIGGVLYREGKYDEALTQYRESLAVQQRLLGRGDPRVATTLNHIGNALMEQGQYAWSREYCERSLKVREETLGRDHPKVAASLNNLGELARKQDDAAGCLAHVRRSLEIVGGTAGPEEDVAVSLAGWALRRSDRPAEAAKMFERLVELRAHGREPNDPVAISAWVMLAQARVAERRFDAAAEIFTRMIGLENDRRPAVVSECWLGLSTIALRRGDVDAARAAFTKVTLEDRGEPFAGWLADFSARAGALADELQVPRPIVSAPHR